LEEFAVVAVVAVVAVAAVAVVAVVGIVGFVGFVAVVGSFSCFSYLSCSFSLSCRGLNRSLSYSRNRSLSWRSGHHDVSCPYVFP